MVAWLTAAGVESTRRLLLIPAQELRFLPRLGTRARLVLARLDELGVPAGCLAEPAPAAEVRDRGPPINGVGSPKPGSQAWFDEQIRQAGG